MGVISFIIFYFFINKPEKVNFDEHNDYSDLESEINNQKYLIANSDSSLASLKEGLKKPKMKKRNSSEWQGMKVRTDLKILCSSVCNLALACINNECSPCDQNDQCLSGEGCD